MALNPGLLLDTTPKKSSRVGDDDDEEEVWEECVEGEEGCEEVEVYEDENGNVSKAISIRETTNVVVLRILDQLSARNHTVMWFYIRLCLQRGCA